MCELRSYSLEISAKVHEGEINDVEALSQIIEFAAPHYQTTETVYGFEVEKYYEDYEQFAEDLGLVLGGVEYVGIPAGINNLVDSHGGLGPTIIDFFRGDISMGEVGDAFSIQFTSPDDPRSTNSQYYVGREAFGATGFAADFLDAGNQVRHFMGGIRGASLGSIGELGALGRESNPDTADYRLHQKAFELYNSRTSLDKWGNWIMENLGQ